MHQVGLARGDFVKYGAIFQNWEYCGCKDCKKRDHLEFRRREVKREDWSEDVIYVAE
jgi:hypothetical protein